MVFQFAAKFNQNGSVLPFPIHEDLHTAAAEGIVIWLRN